MSHLQQLFGTAHPVALVTGSGAPRVGQCIARTLASCGYRLALHANRSAEQAERMAEQLNQSGGEAMAVTADLRRADAVRQMACSILDRFDRIDVLVNCAGIWQPKRLEEVTAEDVIEHFRVNTLATFLCCQVVGLQMVRQPTGGAIVNLGDWATVRPYLHYAAYFPSKGAIEAMTRSLAVELAARNRNIRVNAVLPGPVMLPPEMPEVERQAAIAGTLLRREGSPQNVADAVRMLVENDFITGVCLPVDGGRSIFGGEPAAGIPHVV